MFHSDRFLKKVHSPYTTPVLNASDMCQANRDYYGCTSSSSDDEIDQHLPPTSAQYFARGGVPPPPSYVQATNVARMSSPRTARTATPESEPTTPHTPQGRDAISAIPETIFHSPLVGHCEFIQPPQIPNCDYPTPSFPCYRLFLGQIRFETTAAEVRWIVEYICGVRALKVESRGIGCFLAYFRTPDDMTRVQHLHKRVLFDHSGIWFARSDSQSEYLAGYVAKNLSHIGRGFRLPKDMMVVEEEKLTRALPIPSCPPPNYHLFPTQLPPPPHYFPAVSYDN